MGQTGLRARRLIDERANVPGEESHWSGRNKLAPQPGAGTHVSRKPLAGSQLTILVFETTAGGHAACQERSKGLAGLGGRRGPTLQPVMPLGPTSRLERPITKQVVG